MAEQALKERAEALADLTHHIAFGLRAANLKGHHEGQLSYDAALTAAATIVAAALAPEHA
jgi:hypothetical protein